MYVYFKSSEIIIYNINPVCSFFHFIFHFIDIEKDIDEKGAAQVLEESTSTLERATCVFTVVPNAFNGLEFTETTCYDMIFIRKDLEHLDAMSFLRILRNVGAPMDIVLLLEKDDTMTEEQARHVGFHSVLRKEYQAVQLCSIISDIMTRQESASLRGRSALAASVPPPARFSPRHHEVSRPDPQELTSADPIGMGTESFESVQNPSKRGRKPIKAESF